MLMRLRESYNIVFKRSNSYVEDYSLSVVRIAGDTRERVFESFESYVHQWCLVKQVLHQGDSESKVLAFV